MKVRTYASDISGNWYGDYDDDGENLSLSIAL